MTALLQKPATLCEAIEKQDIEEARRFLEQGADPNEKSVHGSPALLYAASRSLELVKLLVDYGADVNAKTKIGIAPILACIVNGSGNPASADILRFLIDNGADLNIKDNGNRTPLHWATSLGNQPAERIIKRALRNRKKYAVTKLRAERAEQSRLSDIHNTAATRQRLINSRRPRITIRKNTL